MDETSLNLLIDDWLAARDAAARLLTEHLSLKSPRDVLNSQHRGYHLIQETGWAYRTHGIGVDVTRTNGHGGIDFDFATNGEDLFAVPDWWRLKLFAERAIHDTNIDTKQYSVLIDRIADNRDFVQSVIARRFQSC